MWIILCRIFNTLNFPEHEQILWKFFLNFTICLQSLGLLVTVVLSTCAQEEPET